MDKYKDHNEIVLFDPHSDKKIDTINSKNLPQTL